MPWKGEYSHSIMFGDFGLLLIVCKLSYGVLSLNFRTQNSCLKKCRQTCYPKLGFLIDHNKQACSLLLERVLPHPSWSAVAFEAYYSLKLLGPSDLQPPNGLCRPPDGVSWHKKIKTMSPILINFCNPSGVCSVYLKKDSAFHLFISCKHKSHSKAIITPWHLLH
ncbi:uncharacterized protein LOC116472437 [Hylobates moloch]|uniref:uncharacterized protein LOC116472437 n=1 Tax=Hylobates moloch TaxID=81572 RepID=UPI0026773249|nr:uncharacterized protein LOC116472437 [Hylobates moloch]